MKRTVLCYIEKNKQYLLIYRNKKKNDLNEGKWIGVGGHIETNETPDQALLREVKEETNLDLLSFKLRGLIYFQNNDFKEVMYLYTSNEFVGNIKECNEGELHFINKSDILNLNLWEGDRIFLKYLDDDEPYFELELIYENKKLIKVTRLV